MDDRHRDARRRLEDAVLSGPGHLEPEVRAAIAAGRDVPEELRALAGKVAREAYRVTDADFGPARSRYTEDQVFEAVVSAAVGAARERLDAAWRALEDA
jgi:hypothetical protein